MKVSVFCDEHLSGTLEACEGVLWRECLPLTAGARQCKVTFSFPLRDIQQFWQPIHQGVARYIPWNFDLGSAFQIRMPLVAFSNRANRNRMTIALDDLVDDTFIHGDINQEACTYDIVIRIALPEVECPEIQLTLDSRNEIDWQEAIAAWRSALPSVHPAFPAAVWEPVYCSWYAVHAAMNEAWVEKTAPLAKELGFTTLILDDGWCYDEPKRLSPATTPMWYQDVGDWEVATSKFPNFPAHVDRIKALGMHYMVWVAPTLIGDRCELLKHYPDACKDGDACIGSHATNLDDQEVVDLLSEKLARLVREGHLDGLKVDFIDHEPPSLEKPRGRKMRNFVEKISDGIRRGAKDALIEFRQGYATPQMLPYATQFRACDAPFDYMLNLERCLQARVVLGDDTPIHADPAYWGRTETPENVSRHMIAMLAAVPMISMDLEVLTPAEKAIIRHWLDFYREHRGTLNHGQWHIHYDNGEIDYAMATASSGERIALVLSAGCIPGLPKGTNVLNLTAGEIASSVEKAWKMDGTPAENNAVIPEAGRAIL